MRYPVNSYFLDYPEMVLGCPGVESTRYGHDYTVYPAPGADLPEQLLRKRHRGRSAAVDGLPAGPPAPSERQSGPIGERARVDLPYMAQLTGKTEQELTEELSASGTIYRDPVCSEWQTAGCTPGRSRWHPGGLRSRWPPGHGARRRSGRPHWSDRPGHPPPPAGPAGACAGRCRTGIHRRSAIRNKPSGHRRSSRKISQFISSGPQRRGSSPINPGFRTGTSPPARPMAPTGATPMKF